MNFKLISRFATRLTAVLLAVGMAACSSSNETDTPPAPSTQKPTVALTTVATTEDSATVNVELSNAESCYIGYVVKGESEPTAEQLISSGERVAAGGGNHTFTALAAETEYVVLAVAINGEEQAQARLELATTATAPPDESDAIKLNMLLEAVYRSDNSSGVGNYQIVIGNTRELAWNGDMQLNLDFYNELDADPINAILPNGTYTATTTKEVFTFNPEYSYITIMRDGAPAQSPVIGDIYVDREGAEYSIIVDGYVILDEAEIAISYSGPITFVESATAEWTKFDSAEHADFEIGQGRYWGNWFYPFADDFGLEFFQGDFDENKTLVKGYYIQVSNIYMPKLTDYNTMSIEIAPGVYGMVSDSELYTKSFAMPFTFDYGYSMDLFGSIVHAGTYVTYVDRENNISKIGFIVDGTITISGSSSNYNIEFDLLTEEGVSITGTYNGALSLDNWNDNDLNEIWNSRPWTTLKSDYTLAFEPETEGIAYLFGEYLKEGYDSWFISLLATNDANPNGYGDYFMTEILVPTGGGTEFPVGTFNISWDLGANVMIPGYLDHAGTPIFTTFADLTLDSEGYTTHQSAIESGSVTISKLDSGEYKFVFDMEDILGHKITGEWQGSVVVDDIDVTPDDDHDHEHARALANKAQFNARR